MSELLTCPCGKTPTDFDFNLTQGTKWALAQPNCCGMWEFEAFTEYRNDDDPQLKILIAKAWNQLPRALDNGEE